MTLTLRPAGSGDHDGIWNILAPIIVAGETYALPRDLGREAALEYWLAPAHDVFVAIGEGAVVGTCYVRANQQGGGAHVANAAFATAAAAGGRGVARALAAFAIDHARARHFRAMQFNFVVATNARAVALWASLGFATVGQVPRAFAHPVLGDVDALIMHRFL